MFDNVITLGPLDNDTVRAALRGVSSDDEYIDKLVYMTDGNPGAMTAIVFMNDLDQSRAALCLGMCMAWKIKGPMLWLLFKDVCNKDVAKMMDMIELDQATEALEGLHYARYKRPE